MKHIFLHLLFIHLTFGSAQAQSADHAPAFQHTTLQENIQWLQTKLSFTSKQLSDKIKTRTTAEYDSSAQTLTFYFKYSSGASTIKGFRLHLGRLNPEHISIIQIGRPSPSKKDNYMVYEYVIGFQAPHGVNAAQTLSSKNGQEQAEFSTVLYSINLPEPINQDKKALEEMQGRLQQTVLLVQGK